MEIEPIIQQREPTSRNLQSLQRSTLRVDEFIKKYLLREFRHVLKNTFSMLFKNKRHYQCRKTILLNLRNFYTGQVWKNHSEEELRDLISKDMAVLYVPEDVYNQHEEIFAKLVFSTQK